MKSVVDDMQIQPPITVQIHPGRLKGLLHPIACAGNRRNVFKLNRQVRAAQVPKQGVFF